MTTMTKTLPPSALLRERVVTELAARQIALWKNIYGNRPVNFWRSSECQAALDDPDCSNPPQAETPAPQSALVDQLTSFVRQVAAGAIDEARVQEMIQDATADSMTEDRVRALLDEAIAGIQARRVEIRVNDAQPHAIEGRPHKMLERVLRTAASKNRKGVRRNILLVGPTQCGKSTIGEQVAKATGLRYGHLSLTEGVSETHFTGRFCPIGEGGRFQYVPSQFADFYENGGVFVLEEIDSADPNVLLAINNAIANGHMAVSNPAQPVITRHPDFVLLGCANTWGRGADRVYVGRNQLDAATLARFSTATFEIDYDEQLEIELGSAEVVQWAHAVRRRLQDVKLRRQMTTFWIVDISDQIEAGVLSMREAKAMYFQDWTPDEQAKMGTLTN